MGNARVPTCVWRISPRLISALDERFGDPLDAYVNGSQVWVRDDGPGDVTLEWRLHPVAGYRRPAGMSTEEVFSAVALAVAQGEPPAVPDGLWDGLEAFPAYEDQPEPALLRQTTTTALGLAPDAYGLVDHTAIADQWERAVGGVSIIEALLAQLAG